MLEQFFRFRRKLSVCLCVCPYMYMCVHIYIHVCVSFLEVIEDNVQKKKQKSCFPNTVRPCLYKQVEKLVGHGGMHL